MEELNFSSGMTKFDKVAKFEDTILNFTYQLHPLATIIFTSAVIKSGVSFDDKNSTLFNVNF